MQKPQGVANEIFSCKHHLIAEKGGKSEVMLGFNFNEQTKVLPLNLLYFLPTDNQLKDSLFPLHPPPLFHSLFFTLLFTMQG